MALVRAGSYNIGYRLLLTMTQITELSRFVISDNVSRLDQHLDTVIYIYQYGITVKRYSYIQIMLSGHEWLANLSGRRMG